MAALSAVNVVDELAAFLSRDAPQCNPIGALTVQVSVVETVGLGLASNPLGVCIFFGEDLVLEVALDLVDPARVLAHQGQQQAITRGQTAARGSACWCWRELLADADGGRWLPDGGFDESLLENSWLLGFPSRCSPGELIGLLVFPSRDVLELHALEVLLELAYLFKVGHHVGVFRRVALVGEVLALVFGRQRVQESSGGNGDLLATRQGSRLDIFRSR